MRTPPEQCSSMAEVRAGVDALDQELVALLAERFRFMNAAARIVGEGWGVAVVDELSAHTALRPGLTVRPFQSNLRFNLVAATPKTKAPSRQCKRIIRAFADRVKTQLDEMHAAAMQL